MQDGIVVEIYGQSTSRPDTSGVYLKELLDEVGLTQYRLARDIGVPAIRIDYLVHGKRPVTTELALRLGRYSGQSPRYWLNLQSRYDVDVAEDRQYKHS